MIGAAETPAAAAPPTFALPPPQHAPPPERPSMRPAAFAQSAPAAGAHRVPALLAEPKPDALPVPCDSPPVSPPPPPAPTARAAATAVGVSPEAAAVWSKVVHTCVQQHPLLRALVTNSMLVSLEGEKALLSCAERFAAGAHKWSEKLSEVFTRERGATTIVEFEQPAAPPVAAEGGENGGAESGEAGASAQATAPSAAPAGAGVGGGLRPAMPGPGALEHPLVKQAIELFGARVVDVQPPLRRP